MGVPSSEVGYTAAMPRREDHEVHKDMRWGHWGLKKTAPTCFGAVTPSSESALLVLGKVAVVKIAN